jgi:hypothetical protein
MEKNGDDNNGNGWVLKYPYTTNSKGVFFINNSIDKVMSIICRESRRTNLPYIMLQPKLENRFEYKVMTLNRKPFYVCKSKNCGPNGKAFSSAPEYRELFSFVEEVVQNFKTKYPVAIVDGPFRVDVMIKSNGKLIVNEFESFEAAYYCKSATRDLEKELTVTRYCAKFWETEIDKFI